MHLLIGDHTSEAIRDRFHAVLVENGLLRHNEAADSYKQLSEHLGIQVTVVDASQRFLEALSGVINPEKKRYYSTLAAEFTILTLHNH